MRMDALGSPIVRFFARRRGGLLIFCLFFLSAISFAQAQQIPPDSSPASTTPANVPSAVSVTNTAITQGILGGQLPDLSKRENFSPALQVLVLLTVLSLAPAILLMMTSFTRIIIVLSMLRQALGTQQLPPNQVIIGLALFMTFLIMAPTWNQVNSTALQPYLDGKMDQKSALAQAQAPVRQFMIKQIQKAGNDEDVYLFTDFMGQAEPKSYKEVSTLTLIPAFMLSELKTSFLLGFKVYLPFLIIDMVISAILISMGMMMLPPALIAMPFKLLLFVLVDGWRLVVGSLMAGFAQ
jgi:flagellar biosynthetic protein FliP